MASSTQLYGPRFDNPNFLSENHPLRGLTGCPFLGDKIDAEQQVQAYARDHQEAHVTVLRFAPMIGPTVESYITRWLAGGLVPTLLGFDPLLQFVHEVDALAALKLAIDRDVSGIFNIAGEGVLPVSTVIKLAGAGELAPATLRRGAGQRVALAGGAIRRARAHVAVPAAPVRGGWREGADRTRFFARLHHARSRARIWGHAPFA